MNFSKTTTLLTLTVLIGSAVTPTIVSAAETNNSLNKISSVTQSTAQAKSKGTTITSSMVASSEKKLAPLPTASPQEASSNPNNSTSGSIIESQNKELDKGQEEAQNDSIQTKSEVNHFNSSGNLKAISESIDSWMPDKNLQKAISAQLGKDVTQITKEDVSSLTYLYADNMGIDSLLGLEYAVKLGFLDISNNNISDLSPISHVTPENGSDILNSKPNFTLYADNNNISDISPLSSIPSLYRVRLENNQISDVSSLAKSTFIYDLDLNDNQVSDVSYLSGITNLHKLSLTNNHYANQEGEVKNIDSLSKLTNLIELNLTETGISNLDFIKPLVNLEILRVKNNHITDISTISQLPKLSIFEAKNQEFYQTDISIPQANISTGYSIEYPIIKDYDGSMVDLFQYDGSVDSPKWNTISSFNGSGAYNKQNNSILWNGFSSANQTGSLVASFKKVTSQGWEFSGNILNNYSTSEKAADLIINYVDESGKSIPGVSTQIISGNLGDPYDVSTEKYKLTIDGYTLDTTKLPNNLVGALSDTPQTVTYIYTENPIKAADVTVKYVDTVGNKISNDIVKTGNIGDIYTTEPKTIKGYIFKEVQGNDRGMLTNRAQTVTYVYISDNITLLRLPNDHTKIKQSNEKKVSKNKSRLPQTGENKGISVIEIIFGFLLILVTSAMIIFKHQE